MRSPCTQICTLDPTGAYCAGCGRSLAELAAWAGAGEAEQRRIVAAARARLQMGRDKAPSGVAT